MTERTVMAPSHRNRLMNGLRQRFRRDVSFVVVSRSPFVNRDQQVSSTPVEAATTS